MRVVVMCVVAMLCFSLVDWTLCQDLDKSQTDDFMDDNPKPTAPEKPQAPEPTTEMPSEAPPPAPAPAPAPPKKGRKWKLIRRKVIRSG